MGGLIKVNITKSRAGHYTVTMRDERGYVVFRRNYIDNLPMARAILAEAERAYRAKEE